MNAQYKKGVVEVCLLALDITENTIYPMLRRLTDKQYLTYEKERIEAGAPIKKYKLTTDGLDHLSKEKQAWHEFTLQISKILGDHHE